MGPDTHLRRGHPRETRAHTEEDGGVVGPESQSFLPRLHQLEPFSKWQESKQCLGLSHCPSEIPNPLAWVPSQEGMEGNRRPWGQGSWGHLAARNLL